MSRLYTAGTRACVCTRVHRGTEAQPALPATLPIWRGSGSGFGVYLGSGSLLFCEYPPKELELLETRREFLEIIFFSKSAQQQRRPLRLARVRLRSFYRRRVYFRDITAAACSVLVSISAVLLSLLLVYCKKINNVLSPSTRLRVC